LTKVYVCRDVADESVVLSFGLFDGALEELREIQSRIGGPPEAAYEMVEEVLLDGSYEVDEEITAS